MKMDGGGGDADVLVADEDDSARFVVARNITSNHNHGTAKKTSSPASSEFLNSGRRKTQITTETGEFLNTENEKKRYSKSSTSGMSDRKQQSIPERIAHFYYTLGLLCSSHPILILVITTTVVALSCLPLLSLPLPGNRPQEFIIVKENYSVPPLQGFNDGSDWPRWYKGPPIAYIQQVIVKSAVVPWSETSVLTDAFRGPLAEVFSIVESLTSEKTNESTGLAHECFRVESVKSKALKGKHPVLPENGCLIVSPANFWQQDFSKFQLDPDIVTTILNYQIHQKGRSGLAEILLGMNVRETGLKRNPFKARQRIISYAITIVLRRYNEKFVTLLQNKLQKLYATKLDRNLESTSFKESSNNATGQVQENSLETELERLFHIYYPSQSSLFELIPLVATYFAMFIYVYFSMNKVDIVTSKLGMAFSALITVVASLCMSVGLCSLFGMSFEVNARAIYPYLVIVIGLENILVLTRSVVSTAPNLDMKIRVAQGLSKEGWNITKNLLANVTILTIGFFTFIPAIQEFCILAIIGLLSDFFLQTFFFATVLSLDIHRQKLLPGRTHRFAGPPLRTPLHHTSHMNGDLQRKPSSSKLNKMKSSVEMNGTLKRVPSSVSVVAPSHSAPILVKIPKRLKIVYFWARTRFFQRTFTIVMVGWISVIIYESGIVAHFKSETEDVVLPPHYKNEEANVHHLLNNNGSRLSALNILSSKDSPLRNLMGSVRNATGNGMVMKDSMGGVDLASFQNAQLHREFYSRNPYMWRRLSLYHWQVMMGIYNISLVGRYITILPPINVIVPVKPDKAFSLRHPLERENAKYFNWHALANAFEPIDLVDEYDNNIPTSPPLGKMGRKALLSTTSDDPYVPSSPIELALTMLLAIPSVLFIAYLFVVLYRCVCSRNYAEWRESWMKGPTEGNQDHYTQVIFEALPLVLDGHRQEVECIGSDGNVIASVCLAGTLKVWYSSSGENIVTVNRSRYFASAQQAENEEISGWYGSDADSTGCSPPNGGGDILKSDKPRRKDFRDHSRKPSASSLGGITGGAIYATDSGFESGSSYRISSAPIQMASSNVDQTEMRSPSYSFCQSDVPSPVHRQCRTPTSNPASPTMEAKGFLKQDACGDSFEAPPVWCLDCHENLIVLGTGTGRLEIWDGFTGKLKTTYDDGSCVGVMCVKLVGNRIIVARINGSLDFIDIEPAANGFYTESSSPYHRWLGGEGLNEVSRVVTTYSNGGEIRCVWLTKLKAHQQPIVCLDCEGGRILTGSQDHTIKVFRLEDHTPLYTLHGHYGPITCLFIDKFSLMTSGSGSQDGMLCVWDLITGMCMYSTQAHDGPVSGLTYSASYIISVGGDDKICVWERFQGHILNTIHLDHSYCSSLVMLTHNLLITSKRGSLIVWDVRSGEPVRAVRLGHRDNAVFVRQIMSCGDAILCDYGSQLRLVRFPSVVNKID